MIWEKEWTSHIPLLIKVMQNSSGPVLELGAGPGSTPLLYWMCFDMERTFESYDSNQEYVDTLSKFGVKYVESFDEVPVKKYDVVFIDSAPPERRHIDVERFKDSNFIIIHDSQRHLDQYFHYKKIYHLFKYKYKYGKVKPHTTVLSNVSNLDWS
jgi:hypothetical protein